MNIRFEYLYRDAGNFKNWGDIVFSNPRHINVGLITEMARNVLIDRSYFVASKACVSDLHFAKYDEEIDHGWHEVHAFESTDNDPSDTKGRDIEEFIESLRYASRI